VKIRTKFSLSSLIVLVLLIALVNGSLFFLGRAREEAGTRHKTISDLFRAVHDSRGDWFEVTDEINDLVRRGFNTIDYEHYKTALEGYQQSLDTLASLMPTAQELQTLRTGRAMDMDVLKMLNTLTSTDAPETPAVKTAIAAALGERVDAIDEWGEAIEKSLRQLIDEAGWQEMQAMARMDRVEEFIRLFEFAILGVIMLVIIGQFLLIIRPIIQSI
jgi:hypothetical protein